MNYWEAKGNHKISSSDLARFCWRGERDRGGSSENICLNRMRRAAMAESRHEVSLLVASDLPTSFHLIVCDCVEFNKFRKEQGSFLFTIYQVVYHSNFKQLRDILWAIQIEVISESRVLSRRRREKGLSWVMLKIARLAFEQEFPRENNLSYIYSILAASAKTQKSAEEDEKMFKPNLVSYQVCPPCYLSRFHRHTIVRTSIPAEEGKQQSVGLPLTSRLPPSLSRVHRHRTLECSPNMAQCVRKNFTPIGRSLKAKSRAN